MTKSTIRWSFFAFQSTIFKLIITLNTQAIFSENLTRFAKNTLCFNKHYRWWASWKIAATLDALPILQIESINARNTNIIIHTFAKFNIEFSFYTISSIQRISWLTTNAIVEFVKNFTISKRLIWAATILLKRVTCGTSSTYTFEWVYFITIFDLFLIIKTLIYFFMIEISILAFYTIWLGIGKTINHKDRVIFYFYTIPLHSRLIT